jgi:hypothetical protein
MNEYIGTYTVRREMHSRPFVEVGNAAIEAYAIPGVEDLYIRNTGSPDMYEAGQILSLTMNLVGIWRVGQPTLTIDVIARGDADEAILKSAADSVGAVFERDVIITPMSDINRTLRSS